MSGIKDAFLGDTFERDYIPAFQRHSAPSFEAARSIAPHVQTLKQRVLNFFKDHPNGATDEQLIDAFGGARCASTVRPRRIELVQDGALKDSGRYAIGRSKRRATVWCLNQSQSDQVTFSTLMPPL